MGRSQIRLALKLTGYKRTTHNAHTHALESLSSSREITTCPMIIQQLNIQGGLSGLAHRVFLISFNSCSHQRWLLCKLQYVQRGCSEVSTSVECSPDRFIGDSRPKAAIDTISTSLNMFLEEMTIINAVKKQDPFKKEMRQTASKMYDAGFEYYSYSCYDYYSYYSIARHLQCVAHPGSRSE